MAKSENLYARIEPELKEQAEQILATLGIPASNAINMFYKQIVLQQGIPFEVKIPTSMPPNIYALTATELDEELNKGLLDLKEGRTKSLEKAFSDIRKDYTP